MASYMIPQSVVSAELGGEAVLLDTETGQYFGLDETAATIWRQLTDGRSEPEIVELLVSAYEVPTSRAAADVDSFVRELESVGLVRRET